MREMLDRYPRKSAFRFKPWRGSESNFFFDDHTDAGDPLTKLTIQKETP